MKFVKSKFLKLVFRQLTGFSTIFWHLSTGLSTVRPTPTPSQGRGILRSPCPQKRAPIKDALQSINVLSPWGGLGRGLLIRVALRFQRSPCLKKKHISPSLVEGLGVGLKKGTRNGCPTFIIYNSLLLFTLYMILRTPWRWSC